MKKALVYISLIISIVCLIIYLINYNASLRNEDYLNGVNLITTSTSTTSTTTTRSSTTVSSSTTTKKTTTKKKTTITKKNTTTKKTTTKKTTKKTTTKEAEISLKNEEKIESMKLEEYLIGVVACEIPASFNKEALKAQAIASRTYAVYKMEMSSGDYDLVSTIDDQCYISTSEMKTKWGSTYSKYYKKIKEAVNSTEGIVMKKNNKLFKSFYFSTSNGKTRDSQTVFKEGNITSVDSSWDKDAKNFEVTIVLTKESLAKILGDFKIIEIKTRDSDNNVTKVCVDSKCYTGIEFRKKLNLRSTDFIIDVNNNNYHISTKGYGHGVGMSQYGANYLAEKGHNYKYILNYYYNNVKLVNY